MHKYFFIILSCFFCSLFIENTSAESGKNKSSNWIRQCGGAGLKDDQCFIIQNIYIESTGQRLLSVIAGIADAKNNQLLFFTLPLGVYIPTGMAFNVDGGKAMEIPIHVCMPDGCKANIEINDVLKILLMKGKEIKVVYIDANSRKQITVIVTLADFAINYALL
jgi:invasion protein IalB